MLLFHAANPSACGIASMDPAGRIVDFVEKPKQPASDLANAGVYVLTPDAYREIAAMKAFDIGFEVLPRFVGRMRGWIQNGYHRDIGTVGAFEQAKADAAGLLARRRVYSAGRRPAVFFDRDGTLIEQVHYLSDPAQVRLVSGAAQTVARLQAAGFACVVVTNQSAIGRGLITDEDLCRIHGEMCQQFKAEGVELDGIYYCPAVPSADDRTSVEFFDRKPGPGMLWRAANELWLDLSRSWMVGDMVSDVLAGQNAQCAGSILIGVSEDADAGVSMAAAAHQWARDLLEATETILDVPDAIRAVARTNERERHLR